MQTALKAEQVLREYAAVQERLCEALFDQYPIDDVNLLTDLPKHGTLSVGDELWEFQQHGTGVCFTRVPESEVVDAHVEVFGHPGGVDAWRLLLHLESRGIATVACGAMLFDAARQESLEEMLQRLCGEGLLVVADQKRRIYLVRKPRNKSENRG